MSRGYAAIGLYSPKTEANVGGALRAAGCYDAALIVIQGGRYYKQRTDTQKTFRHIPLLHADNLLDSIPYDCVPVCIEINDRARFLPGYSHPERAFYIFGPEDGSVPEEMMRKCRDVIAVPTSYCMNLAATVNVILYDRLAKRGKA